MENPTSKLFAEETIDIKKYFGKILFNWYWFAISIFLAVSVAYVVNRYTEPIYRAYSSVIVRDDERSKGLTGAENIIEGMEMFRSQKNVQNEIGILKSFTITHRAIQELKDFEVTYLAVGRRGIKEAKLYKASPFVVRYDSLSRQLTGKPVYITILSKDEYLLEIDENLNIHRRMKFGEHFRTDYFDFSIELRNPDSYVHRTKLSNKYYFIINSLNGLTNQYRGKLVIEPNDKKGSILTLSTTGYVARQEVDYLNKLMEIYIRSGLEEKNQIATNTIEFVDKQLNLIVDSLNKVEVRLQNFRLQNKVIDISHEGNLIVQKIETLESEKALLEMKENYYVYLLEYINSLRDFQDVIAPSLIEMEDPFLSSLIHQLSELYKKEKVYTFSVEREIPSLKLIQEQIQDTKQAIKENIRNSLNTLSLKKQDLNIQIENTDIELRKLPKTERQYIDIQRNYQVNNDIYTYLLQKRAEAGIAKASNIADNKILDMARMENTQRIKPKTSMNYMMAILAGILVPVILIFIVEYFNNRIISRNDIEKQTTVPILGAIGHNSSQTDLPVFENPKSSLAETFRALRTNLKFLGTQTENKVIAISSSLTGEGKTFCALNLATIIAMSQKKVLLVGLDLRKPKIHKVFNIENTSGVSTYLSGQTELDELFIESSIPNLHLTTSGPIPPNPAELIDSKKMDEFFDYVRDNYDYVVLDTPPIAIVTDALLIAKRSDINIFVIRQNFTSKGILPLIEEIYQKEEIKNLSLIINDLKIGGYYSYTYDYGYGYAYNYGYRYADSYYSDENEVRGFRDRIIRLFRRKA